MTTNLLTTLPHGALRAAQLLPLLLTLEALQPAAAQLPRAPAALTAAGDAVATVVLDPASSQAPLQLMASHVDVQVRGAQALVRTTLTYRNVGTLPVDALYTVPLPALLTATDAPALALGAPPFEQDGCGDQPYELAQFAEAGEAEPPRYEQATVRVGPGAEITVAIARPATLLTRDERHRLVLPLAFQRDAAFTPRFSADIGIAAERPIRSLTSATHGGEAMGLGRTSARLVIPEGRLYEGQFLAFDYELGEADEARDGAAAPGNWGGEGRSRLHAAIAGAPR